MKRNLIIVSIAFIVISIAACKKSCTKVAFTHATMKPWFDTYCASCHASGKSNAGKWLYDPADFTCTIKNNMDNIHSEVAVKKTMPPGGSMTTAELQKFIDWYNAGFPIN